MKTALISLNQCWMDKAANLARCRELSERAVAQKCNLIVFPEMTLTGYTLEVQKIAERIDDSETMRMFGALAVGAGIEIVFGMVLYDVTLERYKNVLCHASQSGVTKVVFAKIHPFSFAGEERVLIGGESLGIIKVGEMNLGCTICYDLRFPELYALMARECQMIVNIANWPSKRVSHWKTLLSARAIENQLFIAGVNRTGSDGNGLVYERSSMLFDPEGVPLEQIYSDDEMDVYDVNIKRVSEYRAAFPTVRDKRYSLYSDLYRSVRC